MTVEEREEAVDRVREELYRLVRQSPKTQRAIERENGFARGYLSQVLHGNMALTARHVLGILLALEIPPGLFFTRMFPEADSEADEALDEIRERLARYDSALRQLEEKGLLAPEEED